MTMLMSVVTAMRLFFTRYFAAGLLLAWSIAAYPAAAHELRPSVVDLQLSSDRQLTAAIELNAEALLAGIGSEHDDTKDSPQAAIYDQLRQLDAATLTARMADFAPTWIAEQNLAWSYAGFSTDAVENIELARKSIVTLTLTPPTDAENLQLSLPPLPDAIALRVTRPGQDALESYWVKQGDSLPVISLALPDAGILGFFKQLFQDD